LANIRRENELFEESFQAEKQRRKTSGKGELAFVIPRRIINSLLFFLLQSHRA
jgi:hypothetical protein